MLPIRSTMNQNVFFFFSLPFLFLDFDSASPSKAVEVCRLEGLDGGNYFYGGRR